MNINELIALATRTNTPFTAEITIDVGYDNLAQPTDDGVAAKTEDGGTVILIQSADHYITIQ